MSLILLGLSTLDKNDGQVPICSLDIRNENCGGNFNCHFQPDAHSILEGLGLSANEDVKLSFAMPQKWFCSEFTLFSLWHMREKSKVQSEEGIAGLEMFFDRQKDNTGNTNKTNKLTFDLTEDEIEKNILKQDSIGNIFEYLEKYLFRCYYSAVKVHKDEEGVEDGFTMLICYQEASTTLEPNVDIKAVFEINYFLDGSTQIEDWILSTDEEFTYLKILDFDKQAEE